jgi:hypothetical protein
MVDDRQQWNLLKRQFDELVRDETASYNSIDDMLDESIRRRFAETITAKPTHDSVWNLLNQTGPNVFT